MERDEVTISRAQARNRVVRSLRDSAFRRRFTVRAQDGTCPLVVALRYDKVSMVVQQVDDLGGAANVVVAEDKCAWILTMTSGPDNDDSSRDLVQMHLDVSVGTLIDTYSTLNDGRGVRVTFDGVTANVPSGGRQISVPA